MHRFSRHQSHISPINIRSKNIFSSFKHHYTLWINFWRRVNKFINREKYADRVWQNQYNSYSLQAQIEQLNILLSGDTLNFISSVRSSYSHPDLLLIHHPTNPLFQITPVLNTGLSLSEPLQQYKGYNAI